jgi:hypothetical protein
LYGYQNFFCFFFSSPRLPWTIFIAHFPQPYVHLLGCYPDLPLHQVAPPNPTRIVLLTHIRLPETPKHYILTLKMAAVAFSEAFDNFQHSTRLISESRSRTLTLNLSSGDKAIGLFWGTLSYLQILRTVVRSCDTPRIRVSSLLSGGLKVALLT